MKRTTLAVALATGALAVPAVALAADGDDPARPETPAPPEGFTLAGREDHRTFTRLRYRAPEPVTVSATTLAPLAPGTPTFPPVLLLWPPA